MAAGGTSQQQQQLVWTFPNDVTAAVENFGFSSVLGERLQPAPRSSSVRGQFFMTALPQLKTLAFHLRWRSACSQDLAGAASENNS